MEKTFRITLPIYILIAATTILGSKQLKQERSCS